MADKDAIRNVSPSFRGWVKPGPLPDLEQMHAVELGEDETLDAISGHWRIFQLRHGHRFSTDDILVAWYGTSWCPSARRVLDLGSGIGSVALVAAWRLPFAAFVTVEAQERSVALARKSARYNGVTGRFDVRLGDIRDEGVFAGDEPFDLVMGSPPYFPPETGPISEHPQRAACRFELRGDVADYCAAAAPRLAPGGVFACVFPIKPGHQRQRVFDAAAAAGLCVVRWRPVALRAEDGPLLGLFLMQRAEDLPAPMRARCWEEPTLEVRDMDRQIHPEYMAVKLSFGFPP
jgi:tRNA1(Val) A37 N6-methylase TrmN6